MEEIAVKPRHAQIMTNVVALGIVCGLSLAVPAAGLVCAMLTPLFACPLVKHKEEWLGWTACVFPAAGWLLNGFDPLFVPVLLLPGVLPMLLTRLLHPKDRTGPKGLVLYWIFSMLSMAAILGMLAFRLGGALHLTLPQKAVDWLRTSEMRVPLLERLALMGLISRPEGYEPGGMLQPLMIQQLLKSLRLTLELSLQSLLPRLAVEGSLLLGLFTTLRVERLNGVMLVVERDPHRPGERKTRVTEPPGFRTLTLPRNVLPGFWAIPLICLLLSDVPGMGETLMLMGYWLFNAVFQIIGAAVLVEVFSRRMPERIVLIGVLAGLIYVELPLFLLILGLSDSFVHYRTRKVRDPDSDS